jgi:hypothetical protein
MAGIILDLSAPEAGENGAETREVETMPEAAAPVIEAEESPEAETLADPFPVEALPAVLGKMAEAIADVGGVPVAMSAPLVLAAASAAIGRGVRVKSLLGRETRASLYLMMGKQSGSGGSGAYRLAMGPLNGFQAAERRSFESGMKPTIEAELEGVKIDYEVARTALKGLKGEQGDSRSSIIEKLKTARRRTAELEAELHDPLFIASDATPEGMANLLSQHGECLFHADADAGDAIGSVLGRYNDSATQSESIWLKSFDGEAVTIVRKNTGVIALESPCLAVCWVATPAKVRELFQNERLSEAGLLPRFLVVDPRARATEIPEDRAGEARAIPSEVGQPYEASIFRALREYRLDANAEPYLIEMTKEARLAFVRDYNGVLQRADFKPDPFQSRLTEQAIRLALLFHLYEHCEIETRGPGTFGADMTGHEHPLSVGAARAGLMVRDWFERRQAEFLGPQREHAKEAGWEKAVKLMRIRDGITARDIYSGRVIAANKAEAEAMLAGWSEEGRVIAIVPKAGTPGRKVTRYKLAPIFAKG